MRIFYLKNKSDDGLFYDKKGLLMKTNEKLKLILMKGMEQVKIN